jgi:hypothetical protein
LRRRRCGLGGWLRNGQALQLHLIELEAAKALAEILQRGFVLLPVQVIAQSKISEADEDDKEAACGALARDHRDHE